MLNGQQVLVTRFETRFLKRESAPKYLNEKCTLLGLVLLLTWLFMSAGLQMRIDDWTFLEGVYCFFITFTTVGFGDLIPGQSTRHKPGHVGLRIFLIIFGLVAMSNMLNAIVNCEDTIQLLKKLKMCCGRKGNVEISEQDDHADMEMNEDDPAK